MAARREVLEDLWPIVANLDLEFAQFNAARTIVDPRPSRFAVHRAGPLAVTTDRARSAAYYNRILGLSESTVPSLEEAIGLALSDRPMRADVELPTSAIVESALERGGFAPKERITWLVSRAKPMASATSVVRLRQEDSDRLLPLLELEGPIASRVWAERKAFYGSARFRAFAVDVDGHLRAMATTFVGRDGAILGNAVTHPEYRRRGFHSELIRARLADARDIGLEWVATDVEPNSISMRNCERAGFRRICEQAVWLRDPTQPAN